MKGKLTIYMEDGTQFFFHTTCDIERTAERMQITFEEALPPFMRSVHSIGVTPRTLAVMRANEAWLPGAPDNEKIRQSELALICIDDPRYDTLRIHLKDVELVLVAEGLKIDWQENQIKVTVRSFLRYERKKTEEHTLFLECFVV